MKLKKMFLAVAAASLVLSLSGCFLLGSLFETITVEVENYNSTPINVYYRVSGTTSWTKSATWVSTGETRTFDLPAAGTYDFKVESWYSDTLIEELLDEDCSYDYGEIDYNLNYWSSGSVSFI